LKVLNLTFRVTFPGESEMAASGAVGWWQAFRSRFSFRMENDP